MSERRPNSPYAFHACPTASGSLPPVACGRALSLLGSDYL